MYESTFQFRERPFVAAPLTDRYFQAAGIEQTLSTLARGIERAEGPGLLIGPAGTGKSLVLHLLAEHFADEFRVALLASAQLCSRRALLQSILYELGLPYRDLEEGELRLSLIDHLDPSDDCPNGLLLLVDEAHTLPLRLLEEIRMITNLVRDGVPRVRLVLAGAPELEERFASPRLQSFQQRLAARCYLKSLNRDETCAYVRWQVAEAGGAPDELFTDAALKGVFESTGGIPRLINQLCDHALIMAAVGGTRQLDAPGIEEAWADLQQLPTPLHGHQPLADSGIVEFGQLSDEGEESFATGRMKSTRTNTSAGIDPTSQFDEIEELLAASTRIEVSPSTGRDEEFGEPEQFHPAQTPEVELVFHDAHNPFGTHFDEEEVVIDRYASLESVARRRASRVSSDEGQEIAAALRSVQAVADDALPELESAPTKPARVEYDESPPDDEFLDPAHDPVLPESGTRIETAPRTAVRRSAASIAATAREQHTQREAQLRVAMTDDREAIVIDDARSETDHEGVHPMGKVRRQEYRQLFAKLRRG